MNDGVAPDKAELGDLGRAGQRVVHTLLPLTLYIASAVLLVTLLAIPASSSSVGASAALSATMLLLWTAAAAVARLAPVLWGEPHRLSYDRVAVINCQYPPRTLHGYAAVFLALADWLVLPLCLAASAFHAVKPFSYVTVLLYPPHVVSRVPFLALFWTVPLIVVLGGVALLVVVLLIGRPDPDRLHGSGAMRAAAAVAAALVLPAATLLLSAFPCANGSMRFAPEMECQSRLHRFHMFAAVVLLSVLAGCLDIVTWALHYLEEPREGVPLAVVPRVDRLYLELGLMLRWVTLVIATCSSRPYAYPIVMLVAGGILSRASCSGAMSSVAALTDLYSIGTITTLSSSVLCFCLTVMFPVNHDWGVVVWASFWVMGLAAGAASYVWRRGMRLLAPHTDPASRYME